MPRLGLLPPDELDPAQRVLYERITGGPRAQGPQHFDLVHPGGSLAGPFNAMLLSPSVGTALESLGSALRFSTGLAPRIREITILMVAAHWGSAFERQAHEGVGQAIGLTNAELAAIRVAGHPAYEDPRELACALLVEAMLQGDVDDLVWTQSAEAVGAATVFELSTLVGYYATLALQLRVFRAD